MKPIDIQHWVNSIPEKIGAGILIVGTFIWLLSKFKSPAVAWRSAIQVFNGKNDLQRQINELKKECDADKLILKQEVGALKGIKDELYEELNELKGQISTLNVIIDSIEEIAINYEDGGSAAIIKRLVSNIAKHRKYRTGGK